MTGLRLLPVAVAAAVIVLAGCSRRPKEVIPEDRMVDIVADLELAEAYIRTSGPELSDSVRKAIPEAVLARHGVSYAQFDTTLAYYGRNADEYLALFDKVDRQLKERRRKIDGNVGVENLDVNNIWPYPAMTMFTRSGVSDGLTFSIPAEGLTPGEILEWRLRTSTPADAQCLLGVDYTDGTAAYIKRHAGGNRQVSLKLQTDTGRTVSRIYGDYRISRDRMPLWADSIMLVHSPYDSLNYFKVNQQYRFHGVRKTKKNPEPADADSLRREENAPAVRTAVSRPGR